MVVAVIAVVRLEQKAKIRGLKWSAFEADEKVLDATPLLAGLAGPHLRCLDPSVSVCRILVEPFFVVWLGTPYIDSLGFL